MDGTKQRIGIAGIALVGLAVSLLHLIMVYGPSSAALTTPKQSLAQNMEVFELSLEYGSPYSVHAYRAIESECGEQQADPLVAQACTLFDDAVQHSSNPNEIARAVHLLRDNQPPEP